MTNDHYSDIKYIAKNKVLDFITKAARTEWEIAQRIKKFTAVAKLPAGQAVQLSEELIEELKENLFIDDKRYAKEFTQSVVNSSKPRNKRYIKNALLKKHVVTSIIETVLQTVPNENEEKAIQLLLNKKAKNINPNDFRALLKLKKYLYSKGYNQDTIKNAIDTHFGVK